MKRTVGILAGVATLAAGVYLGSQLWAQPGAPYTQAVPPRPSAPPGSGAAPRTRIALINLGQVIKNYQKYKNFEGDIKKESDWFQSQLDMKKKQVGECQARMATTADSTARDTCEKQIKTCQREMEDLVNDRNQRLGKKEFEQLVQTYKEVKDAVEAYARSNDIELVVHYNDGVDQDAYLPMVFQRHLANGACWPMYVAPGMDITGIITSNLNSRVMTAAPAGVGVH